MRHGIPEIDCLRQGNGKDVGITHDQIQVVVVHHVGRVQNTTGHGWNRARNELRWIFFSAADADAEYRMFRLLTVSPSTEPFPESS
jgi:hypothetical protein